MDRHEPSTDGRTAKGPRAPAHADGTTVGWENAEAGSRQVWPADSDSGSRKSRQESGCDGCLESLTPIRGPR